MSEPEAVPRLAMGLTSPVVVGRSQQLASLRTALEDRPSLVVIEGEAGVGKSRLVREATSGVAAVTGHCHPLRDPAPLGPVVRATAAAASRLSAGSLSPLTGALRSLLPELGDILPPPPPPLGDPISERDRVLRAIGEVLGLASPIVVVLEDLQWADASTLDLLRVLLAEMPPGLTVVLTHRPEGSLPLLSAIARPAAPVHVHRLSLRPLDADGVSALIAAILGVDRVSEEFAAFVHERTAGIPFAVEEVLGLLLDRNDIVRGEQGWSRRTLGKISVPGAVRDSVLERVAGLGSDARACVEAAAILMTPATEQELASVAALTAERVRDGILEALASGALIEDDGGRYGTRHSLAAQAVADAIPTPLRRRAHDRAAAMLAPQGEAVIARLARHLRDAGDVERWVEVTQEAAMIASRAENHDAAARFLIEILPEIRVPSACAQAGSRLAYEALHGGPLGEAVAAIEQALTRPDLTGQQRGVLRAGVGTLRAQMGDVRAARAAWEHAVDELGDDAQAASPLMNLAIPVTAEGTMEEHLHWLERAVIGAARVTDPIIRASVPVDRASILTMLADPAAEEAREVFAHPPRDIHAAREHGRGAANVARALVLLGFPARAVEFHDRAAAIAAETGYRRLDASLAASRALCDLVAGAWDGLDERARGLATATSPGARLAGDIVGGIIASAGSPSSSARTSLSHALGHAAGFIQDQAWAAAALARVLREAGDPAGGLVVIEDSAALLRRKGVWAWMGPLLAEGATCARVLGRLEWIEQALEECAAGASGREVPWLEAALAFAGAELAAGRGEDPAAGFSAAAAAFAAIPAPPWEAWVHETHADAVGRRDAAGPLGAALEIWRTVSPSAAARVTRQMREAGERIPAPWRGGRRGYGTDLSPRERDVCVRAGAGLTNSEIAADLYLSASTVANHLASAMRKLGLTSRRQLRGMELSDADQAITALRNAAQDGHSTQ